mmetsp:Transcript_29663/g.81649  ORF Transcript_29663/g.81649 Transcript_29663/m.81649 type:complete len:250 (-) Transcript_29663:12-761(-)
MSEEGGSDGEIPDCALVEYVRGIMARKWTLISGQTYMVGRKDSGADIQVDHASISRHHCSMAITRTDAGLVLVALDPGSTNGTFVNKRRLEKGVGLTLKLAELRHLVFGECQNGYRILVRGVLADHPADGHPACGGTEANAGPRATAAAARSRSRERGGAGRRESAEEAWRRKAEEAKKLKEEAERRQRERKSQPPQQHPSPGTAVSGVRHAAAAGRWRSSTEERLRVAATARKPEAEAVEIDWPEDWR